MSRVNSSTNRDRAIHIDLERPDAIRPAPGAPAEPASIRRRLGAATRNGFRSEYRGMARARRAASTTLLATPLWVTAQATSHPENEPPEPPTWWMLAVGRRLEGFALPAAQSAWVDERAETNDRRSGLRGRNSPLSLAPQREKGLLWLPGQRTGKQHHPAESSPSTGAGAAAGCSSRRSDQNPSILITPPPLAALSSHHELSRPLATAKPSIFQ